MKEADRTRAFSSFLDTVNRLLADESLREVLRELDAEGEEAFDLLATDPASFLRFQGVDIPDGYRVAVTRQPEPETAAAGKGTTTTAYCLRICWWRWCVTICIIITRTTTRA
jgi:hypothetical protein